MSGLMRENDKGQFESITVDDVMEIVQAHTPRYGIMASPSHWAYRGDWAPEGAAPRYPDETPGRWFAHCDGDSRTGERGCGWDSEPITWETREEARQESLRHLAEMIVGVQR